MFKRSIKIIMNASRTKCKTFCNSSSIDIKFSHNYSFEEENRILKLVNSCNLDDLKRYSISHGRATKLIIHRKKYGEFRNLHQLLTVENFGSRVLTSFCQSILNPVPAGGEQKPIRTKAYHFVTPDLGSERIRKMKSVVGVSLGPLSISWAGIDVVENNLFSWGYHAIPLSPEVRRHDEIQILDVAYDAYSHIPIADTYILESSWSAGRTQQSANVSVSQFRLQLSAMLAVLLNQSTEDHREDYKVVFQRSSLWCRLYGTLVGSERVSASSVMTEILDGTKGPFSPVRTPAELREEYYRGSPLQREAMGAAFLLTLCFLDVNVKGLPQCLKILRGRAK